MRNGILSKILLSTLLLGLEGPFAQFSEGLIIPDIRISHYGGKSLLAQTRTVGLLSFNHEKAMAGYNLHFPHNQGNVYLLDNCGQIVHVWEDLIYKPGNGIRLMPNGDIIVCKGRNAASNPGLHAGGGGELIERRDWDNNLIWQFVYNDDVVRLHHDMAVMPNGNVLAIAWEVIDSAAAVAAGRNPALLSEGELWPDKVIEIQPDGAGSAAIVWEWRAWDHLVQDFDPTAPNYDVVGNRPERINVNYDMMGGIADWHHANSIDYNADLDQIILSVPHFDEIWIIDHSTSSAQAAGSTGGLAGKGGDLLFRWGNPEAYDQGSAADRKLFFNHDAHWADIELTSASPNYQKVALFNNQVGPDYSSAHLLVPNFDTYEWEYTMSGSTWGPADFDWSYQRPIPQDLNSSGLSSIQLLPNGNTLIASGRQGYAFELTPTEEIVWEYVNPMQGGNPVDQGTVIPPNANLLFRFHRYSSDYPAFSGRDLSPQGFIELMPDPEFCALPTGLSLLSNPLIPRIWPNPVSSDLFIDLDPASAGALLEIFDINGRKVFAALSEGSRMNISAGSWPQGTYALRLNGSPVSRIVVMR